MNASPLSLNAPKKVDNRRRLKRSLESELDLAADCEIAQRLARAMSFAQKRRAIDVLKARIVEKVNARDSLEAEIFFLTQEVNDLEKK